MTILNNTRAAYQKQDQYQKPDPNNLIILDRKLRDLCTDTPDYPELHNSIFRDDPETATVIKRYRFHIDRIENGGLWTEVDPDAADEIRTDL